MKGGSRSNRVTTTTTTTATEPADDWGGDGSWTVDCICGVTFDDGEEMVNCDDCGVWVHTRCSRFVKADKSFACHKCKSKMTATTTTTTTTTAAASLTHSDETEVAQLLVELPTKTLHHRHPPPPPLPPKKIRLSLPLWTDRPLEDRVHVQGVPGDHTALFPDPNPFPVIISSTLWNASGYIPKRFNFRYSEFPCWSENGDDPPPAVDVSLADKIPPVKPPKRSRPHSRDRPPNKKSKLTAGNPSTTTPLPSIAEAGADKTPSNGHLSSSNNLEKSKRNEDKLAPNSPKDHAVTVSLDKSTNGNKKELILAVDESQTAHFESPTCTSDMPKAKPLIEDSTNSASKCTNTKVNESSETFIPFGHSSNETKPDGHFDNPKGVASQPTGNQREHVSSPDQECKVTKSEGVTNGSKPLEQDGKDSENGLEAVGDCQVDRKDEVTKKQKHECEGSNSSMEVNKSLHDAKDVSKGAAGQTPQPSGAVPPPPSHQKLVSAGKSATATAIVFARSNLSNKSKSGGSQNPVLAGKRLTSSSCANTKKEHAPVDLSKLSKNEEKHDKPMSTLKDNQKPHLDSSLKASQPSRTVLKCYASVGKDSLRHSSSKVSSIDSSLVSSSASEPADALPSEPSSNGQSKNIVSGSLQQTENVPQSNVQPSSKSTQSSTGHPTVASNSPAGLSDEELALLLHQELNSSPRVPRVPRVRNAGSLPQLSSATAANMLMKRTSTSGGRDKNTFSRRKSRDALKDGSRNYREQDREASKVDRMPSSLDPVKKAETSTLAEANTDSKVKKNREKLSSSAGNSSPFSTVESKPSSARVNNLEDETGANKSSDLTCRTLPGLIAEIMGEGRRMAYEELCNAVLPHWPNLRKHNGERYAYSSHSQAVLDCLRNRTEWARLVDRGPKTSSGRKKRKVDTEPLSSESEDGEDKNLKEDESKSSESNKEEYPKGLRKVRKRRRPAPQGRSVKDDKKRRKVEIGSSSDSGTSSNSSEDSASSEDDSQGSEMDVANTDVSLSSH